MSPTLNQLAAREHGADLLRGARRPRRVRHHVADGPRVELRLAAAQDDGDVRRLAALDEARELDGPVLLAVLDGDPVAALALDDGRAVADPFVRTEQVIALLRLRARHLTPARHRLSRPAWLRAA